MIVDYRNDKTKRRHAREDAENPIDDEYKAEILKRLNIYSSKFKEIKDELHPLDKSKFIYFMNLTRRLYKQIFIEKDFAIKTLSPTRPFTIRKYFDNYHEELSPYIS